MIIRLSTLLVFLACFSVQAQLRFTKEVANIATLKQLNVADINKTAMVRGYVTNGDGGGGLFEYDATATGTPDSGIRIAPNVGAGMWIRKVDGREYMARWWGPNKTNSTLQAAINWVSTNGYGGVTVDGGIWTVKTDDSTRPLMKSGVTLKTAEDSMIISAPHPTNDWILIDFPIGASDCGVGPARLIGWNLLAPGGDTNKTGLIFSLQDTTNVVIGGVKADNWYTSYADVGSGNINLKMLDEDWQEGAKAFGAKGDGVRDDTRAGQDYAHFAERYNRRFHWRGTTNGYLVTSMFITNGIGLRITGENTLMKQYYYNPEEGVVPRFSSVFTISAPNTTVEGFHFTQVGAWPSDETNNTSGFSYPVNIHLASNVVVRNCRFDEIGTGKAIGSSGSYNKILNNTFIRSGISFGVGQRADWLFYESPFPPYTKDPVYRSPLAPLIEGNTFIGSNTNKHLVLLSGTPDFSFVKNDLVDINVPAGAVIAYSGDAGFTDANGTNIYVLRGLIKDNTISGNFGPNGAIIVRLNTDTNLVQAGFIVSNMVSAVTVEGNTINGTGVGIELRKAPHTKIRNNYVRVTSSPIWFIGDCSNTLVDGGHYESTTAGIGATISFSVGFLAPADFRDITIRNCRIISSAGDEFAIRNVEPLFVDGFTLENIDFDFMGAVGSGDSPRVVQLTASRGFINVRDNTFLVTNSLNAGRIAYLTTTNGGDITFDNNIVFDRTPGVIHRRGVSLAGRVVKFVDNDVGCLEVNNTVDLLVSGNHLSGWTNGPSPLDVSTTIRGVFVGNVISNYSTVSALAADIGVQLGTFANNSVFGNSSGDIVRSTLGKLYVHNNAIQNVGGGLTYPNGTGTGTVSDDIYERGLPINIGSLADWLVTLRRDGSSNVMALHTDAGNAGYYSWPFVTNLFSGHTFQVHEANTPTNQFAKAFSILEPPGTNVMLRLDANRDLRAVGIGSGISFDGTTISAAVGGGGLSGTLTAGRIPVASGPTNVVNSSMSESDTNIVLFRNNTQGIFLITSNTLGATRFGQQGVTGMIEIESAGASLQIAVAGVNLWEFGTTSFGPFTDNNLDLGTGPKRVKTAKIGTSIELGTSTHPAVIQAGGGNPETVILGNPGDFFIRTNGFAGNMVYVKESGVATTSGWVPYGNAPYVLDFIRTAQNPADGATTYIGRSISANTALYSVARARISRSGTVKSVAIKVHCTAGSAEVVNFYLRLNDTTDFANVTASMNVNAQELYVSGLSQAVANGDDMALKVVFPTFATDPTAASFWAHVIVEPP